MSVRLFPESEGAISKSPLRSPLHFECALSLDRWAIQMNRLRYADVSEKDVSAIAESANELHGAGGMGRTRWLELLVDAHWSVQNAKGCPAKAECPESFSGVQSYGGVPKLFRRKAMSCNSGHRKQTLREESIHRAAQIFSALLEIQGRAVPADVLAAKRYHIDNETIIPRLFEHIDSIPSEERNQLLYGVPGDRNRWAIADWWERHQKVDLRREARHAPDERCLPKFDNVGNRYASLPVFPDSKSSSGSDLSTKPSSSSSTSTPVPVHPTTKPMAAALGKALRWIRRQYNG